MSRSFIDVPALKVFCLAAALIGQHLIEPYLSLTYHGTVAYDKLFPAMQQLYTDLCETDPAFLLGMSS